MNEENRETWHICPDDDYADEGFIIRNDSGALVAIVQKWDSEPEAPDITKEAERNAHLVESAPETTQMLVDLADVVEAYLVHGHVNLPLWIAKARMQAATALNDDAERQYQADLIEKEGRAA